MESFFHTISIDDHTPEEYEGLVHWYEAHGIGRNMRHHEASARASTWSASATRGTEHPWSCDVSIDSYPIRRRGSADYFESSMSQAKTTCSPRSCSRLSTFQRLSRGSSRWQPNYRVNPRPSSFARSVARSTASINAARKPRSSSTARAAAVVPPGEVTRRRRSAGSAPVSFTSFAVP